MRSLFAIPLIALIAAAPPKPVTPTDIVASAPEKAWQTIPADDLMVMDLKNGGRVERLMLTEKDVPPKH